MWFFNQKRADQVAQSISQLIHTLSDGRKNHGPTSPERLLRELATLLSEDTIIGQRVVKLLPTFEGDEDIDVAVRREVITGCRTEEF